MGFFDSFGEGFSNGVSSGSWVGPLISGGLQLAGGLAQGPAQGPQVAYGNTQAGFEAQMAFEREKLAAQLAAGGGGGGSGNALEAAKINARVQIAGLREKQMGDALAAQLRQQEASQQSRQQSSSDVVQAAQMLGRTGMEGFQGMGGLLSRFAR